MEDMQSAYRQFYSTERALLHVKNDILITIDQRKMVALVLLDLSVAFDTIDHNILLRRMESRFGITGSCLEWVKDYLSNRCQIVHIDNNVSEPKVFNFGVPHRSVLGPILFTMYTTPVGDITRRHGIMHHFYVDDTQLYVTLNPRQDFSAQLYSLSQCIGDNQMWIGLNVLKLNDDKTEVLLIGSNNSLNHLSPVSVKVGNASVTSSQSVTNLGCNVDSRLNMNDFIIRKCLKSFIFGQFTGLINICICHITIGLCKQPLIWCTTCSAEQILVHKFNSIRQTAPSYLADLISPYTLSRTLWWELTYC